MIKSIKKRRSIRKYKDKEIEEQKIDEIIRAGCYAPSAKHKYPYQLTLIKDQEKRNKLSKATPYASFLKQAPLGIAIASEEVDAWIEDSSVVAQNIQLEATNQGLGSCWIQIKNHKSPKSNQKSEEIVKKTLGISEDKRVLCIIAIGYPAEQKSPHTPDELEKRDIRK